MQVRLHCHACTVTFVLPRHALRIELKMGQPARMVSATSAFPSPLAAAALTVSSARLNPSPSLPPPCRPLSPCPQPA